jgi:hypothetical protein
MVINHKSAVGIFAWPHQMIGSVVYIMLTSTCNLVCTEVNRPGPAIHLRPQAPVAGEWTREVRTPRRYAPCVTSSTSRYGIDCVCTSARAILAAWRLQSTQLN